MFLNRRKEKQLLRSTLSDDSGNLIILYGRRRIGKSTLLNEIISKKDVYFLADMRETPLQIRELQKQISERYKDFANIIIPNWDALFTTLKNFIRNPFTLVMDEFPYLVKNAPELPSIIQKEIDMGNLSDINLILCGSSQSMMTNLFDSAKSPLYGRASSIIKLGYLSVFHLQKLLNISAEKAVEEYSIWGGVPRYWVERTKYNSLFKAAEYLVLSKYSLFYDEPIILFLDEMRTSMQSNSILSLVGNGVNKLSEIAGRLGKPATNLSKPLQLLIELSYLKREVPFGEKEKNAKRSLYKIADPFLNFYFRFVVPHRSLIELGLNEMVMKKIKSEWNRYVSAAYEDLCRLSIPFLLKRKGNFIPAKRYWNKYTEIDIISIDADNNIYVVGEVKWNDRIKLNTVMNSLDKKITKIPFLKEAKIIKVIFGKKHIQKGGVLYFSAEDVVNALKDI